MKNIRKIIISALTVAALVSVCAACKDNNKAQTSEPNTSTTQSSTESSVESIVSDVPLDIQSDAQSSEELSKDDDMTAVDDRIKKLTTAEDFKSASEQNKLEAVETLLNELAKEGLIIDGSVEYDVYSGLFSFQYKSGALGGIMMKDFDENMN